MVELNLSNDLKIGRQEILLDPTKKANKCGSKVDPLLLNDLHYKKTDGTFITAVEFMLQENISIDNLNVVMNAQQATITWTGTNDVKIYLDGAVQGVPPTGDREHITALTIGQHTILVQATRDRRGLSKTVVASEASQVNLTVEYGGE